MKPVLKYPGAKNRIAPWILEHMPMDIEVYVEPFFGGGAIFFAKPPSRIETINDLDGRVVNFFRVAREKPEQLAQALRLTPFSRQEYNATYKPREGRTDIEEARIFAVQCWQGFGCSNNYHNGWRSSQQKTSPHCTKEWGALPDRIIEVSKRLMNAQIECLPAVELVQRYNTSDVFLYVDPPYLSNTRKGYLYRHEMADKDHEELLHLLVNHPGRILISGYQSDMYDEHLTGWSKEQKRTQAEGGLSRTETIWMNYDEQTNIFDFLGG